MAQVITKHSKYSGNKKGPGVIVSRTDIKKLREGLKMKLGDIETDIVECFKKVGEKAVKVARERGSYSDVTGNLRSSIGYVILKDGEPVQYGAPQAFKGKKGDGERGVAEGQSTLQRLQTKYPKGITLIVCAGMNYAAFVEAIRHKDVLTSAQLEAEAFADKLLRSIVTDK